MHGKAAYTFMGTSVVLVTLLGIAYAVAPVVTLDSPPNGFTTTDRTVDLVATVTDADSDPMTVSFYGGTSDPPTGLLYREQNVPSGTQVTYTCENPVLAASTATVALWHFDEGSGTIAADASGNGLDGAITNATWTEAGKFGQALQFDGDGDYVRVLDDPGLDLTDEVTVSAWVRGRGADFTSVVRQPAGGYAPQLQVVGDRIFSVFSNSSQIFTAVMNTDGTDWTVTQRTASSGTKHHPQMQVAGDSLWCIWRQEVDGYWQHFVGVVNVDGTGWSSMQVSTDLQDHF